MINLIEETKKIDIKNRIRRAYLVQEIWDSIVEETQEMPVADWHEVELKKRHESYLLSPNSGLSWDEVKKNVKEGNV